MRANACSIRPRAAIRHRDWHQERLRLRPEKPNLRAIIAYPFFRSTHCKLFSDFGRNSRSEQEPRMVRGGFVGFFGGTGLYQAKKDSGIISLNLFTEDKGDCSIF